MIIKITTKDRDRMAVIDCVSATITEVTNPPDEALLITDRGLPNESSWAVQAETSVDLLSADGREINLWC